MTKPQSPVVSAKVVSAAVVSAAVAALTAAPASGQMLSAKRGFAGGASFDSLQATAASWYYNWGSGPGNNGDFGALHYPMFWNAPSQTTIDNVRNRPGVQWVLGFNEPERRDQANMTVTRALDSWSQISNSFVGSGIKLVSPAVSDDAGGQAWFRDFMAGFNDRRTNPSNPDFNPNLQMDAVAFHWYGVSNPNNPAAAASGFLSRVDSYWNTYKLPVFITEFAIHDWGGNYTDEQIIEANRQFINIVIPALESRNHVLGYSWYQWFTDARLFTGTPPTPTPMSYGYIGAISAGRTENIAGRDLGNYAAYLTGGTLAMNGSTSGTIRYVSALANTSTITGNRDWAMSGSNGWVRVQPDAVLRKTGAHQLAWQGLTLTNDGLLDVAQGTLRLEAPAAVTGSGTLRLSAGATLVLEPGPGTLSLAQGLDLRGGTLQTLGGRVQIGGTATLHATTSFAVSGTTTLSGPLQGGAANAGLTKLGSGLLVLSGGSSFDGPTRLVTGTTAVSGRLYGGAVGTSSAVIVGDATLFVSNFSDQPAGSLGNLPAAANRIFLDGSTLRIASSGTSTRGFSLGGGGATIDLLPGVNLTLLDAAAETRIVSNAGGRLALAGSGTGTLGKAFAGAGGLVKAGPGTWTIGGANSHTGGTVVEAGRLVVASAAALGSGLLDVRGGTLALPVHERIVATTDGLAIDREATGRLDLGRGRLEIASGGISREPLLESLQAGRHGGAWNGPGGIVSSGVTPGSPWSVGYLLRGDGSSVVSWAALGDADLDGTVSTADLNAILTSGLLNSGHSGAVWSQGDFDYDGRVTTADVNALLATGLLNTGSYLPPPATLVGVPEPTSWLLLVMAAAGATAWRRAAAAPG
jgi:autotransporter-associated beta strand protein